MRLFKIFEEAALSLVPFQREVQKKCPASSWGDTRGSLSRGVAQTAAWEGSLAYGAETKFLADNSGGTAAESHGLPRCPCLQIVN
jgi:hypothetical protein